MNILTRPLNTVQMDDLLTAAAARATAKFPTAATRIAKGLALVREQDAVTDMRYIQPRLFRVQSQTDPTVQYDVVSNGTTTCTCPNYQLRGPHEPHYLCKHSWAVLLVRAAKKDFRPNPRLRHAYHLASGEEGFAGQLSATRMVFYPGGHVRHFACDRADLTLGPPVQ